VPAKHRQVGEHFGPLPTDDDSGLPARPRPPRKNIENAVGKQLRLTEDEIAVLDRKRAEVGNPSRSEFVTVLAELYLATV
jgi:hypothetical protein